MEVLLTHTASPTARFAARLLADAGHVVRRCHDDDEPTRCVVDAGGRCPLDVMPIDVIVAVRAHDDGRRCGVRRGLPVVLAKPGLSELAARVDAAAHDAIQPHSQAATETLRRSFESAGLPPVGEVEVCRHNGFLKASITTPHTVPEAAIQRGAVRICQALRALDPDARGIDVVSPKEVAR